MPGEPRGCAVCASLFTVGELRTLGWLGRLGEESHLLIWAACPAYLLSEVREQYQFDFGYERDKDDGKGL